MDPSLYLHKNDHEDEVEGGGDGDVLNHTVYKAHRISQQPSSYDKIQ